MDLRMHKKEKHDDRFWDSKKKDSFLQKILSKNRMKFENEWNESNPIQSINPP
jgi:hypothetical protein